MNNPLRSLYKWVLRWAEHPAGTWALFVLAVVESSVFPIPPDPLQMALAFGKPRRSFWYATVSLVGSVLGGILGYGIGWLLWDKAGVSTFFFNHVFSRETFDHVGVLYHRHDLWIVFIAAFTPIPYKVITITAGVWKLNFPLFVLVSIVGRGARFFLVAGLIYWLGERVKPFIDKYLELLTILFTLLLIGGFVAIKYLL